MEEVVSIHGFKIWIEEYRTETLIKLISESEELITKFVYVGFYVYL